MVDVSDQTLPGEGNDGTILEDTIAMHGTLMGRMSDIAATVGEKLAKRHQRVATIEATTGGLIGASLLSVPGSSRYFVGSMCIYSTRAAKGLVC